MDFDGIQGIMLLCAYIMLDNKWESVAHEILEHIVK